MLILFSISKRRQLTTLRPPTEKTKFFCLFYQNFKHIIGGKNVFFIKVIID